MSDVYYVLPNAAQHTCWYSTDWDGNMEPGCLGCDEADDHPCIYCGYGNVFTTHNAECHRDGGDTLAPSDDAWTENWANSPHVYTKAIHL